MVALTEALGLLVTEVAAIEIAPRYRHLAASDIIAKPTARDPHDLVTSADRAAEAALSARLLELLPGSTVVGEEAVAQSPQVLDALRGDAPVWLVDPVDGTKNFARGEGAFGSMVALVKAGEILVSAIYLIAEQDLYLAERGAGATRNGAKLCAKPPGNGSFQGTVYTVSMQPSVRDSLNVAPEGCQVYPPPMCAAFEYARLARGDFDFAVFYLLQPWDHAPGALILREAGGAVRHFDAREYGPHDPDSLLLVSSSEARWSTIRDRLRR